MIDTVPHQSTTDAIYGRTNGLSVDVPLVGLYALAAPVADAVLVGSAIRLFLLGPMLLFVPGYALVLALFPTSPESHDRKTDPRRSAMTVDGVERTALSIGSSVALLPVVGLVLAVVFGDLTGPLIPSLSAFTLPVLLAGVLRRRSTPEHRRFVVPLESLWEYPAALVSGESRTTTLLNLLLAVFVLATIAGFGYGLAAPQSGTTTTNVMVGTGSGESFTLGGYESANESGEREYTLLVENDEGEQMEYLVVVQLQRVSDGTVTESSELDRFTVGVEDGEREFRTHAAEPTLEGDDVRLTYLVYVDDPPESPDVESAYRSAYVWIDGSDAGEG